MALVNYCALPARVTAKLCYRVLQQKREPGDAAYRMFALCLRCPLNSREKREHQPVR